MEEPKAAPAPEKPAPGAAASADSGTSPGEAREDHSSAAAEVFCSGVQLTAGIVLDAPEETTATAAEHRHMVNATAAYIRSQGWQASPFVGVVLVYAAWLLKVMKKPKPSEKVRGFFSGFFAGAEPRDVTPEPARPVGPHSPAPAHGAEIIDLPRNIPPLAPRS